MALGTAVYPFLRRWGSHAFSRSVAAVYAATQPAVVETVRRNLALLGGEPSSSDARRVFQNYARSFSDYIGVGTMKEKPMRELCGEFVGREHIESALAAGGGVLATGHYSFFEYGAVMLSSLGYPVTVATMSEPSAELTSWRAGWRRRWGIETVEVGADPFSSLAMQAALEKGRFVAVLADRPLPGQGVRVGRLSFSTSPAVLASLGRAPLVPVVVTLRPDGRYRLVAREWKRVERAPHGGRRKALEDATRDLATKLLEEIVRDPTQWYQFVPLE